MSLATHADVHASGDFIETNDDNTNRVGPGRTLGSGPDCLDDTPDGSIGEFDPVDIDIDSDSECWGSVRSSVYRHFWERGRRYHRYRYGRYPIPNDVEEQNRDELKHAMHMEITE